MPTGTDKSQVEHGYEAPQVVGLGSIARHTFKKPGNSVNPFNGTSPPSMPGLSGANSPPSISS